IMDKKKDLPIYVFKHYLKHRRASVSSKAVEDFLCGSFNRESKISSEEDLDTLVLMRNAIAHSLGEKCQKVTRQNFDILFEGIVDQKLYLGMSAGLKVLENLSENDWEFRLIKIAAFILPETTREEWLGDLKEALYKLRADRYLRWIRTLIAAGRICLL